MKVDCSALCAPAIAASIRNPGCRPPYSYWLARPISRILRVQAHSGSWLLSGTFIANMEGNRMSEKVLNNKKNGMVMMLLFIVLYAVGILAVVYGAGTERIPVMVIGIIWLSVGWIPFLGLRVLKPQEALVITLFGKYVGTLKEDGFYYVNPFCTSVNPAAKTKLNQSGDVDDGSSKSIFLAAGGTQASLSAEATNKKISLKIMTLNNNRQKINDCLGNPVEIGIAVTWRVVDTAKAVFNVDNYKEYLSLQCDSALRNIVRIYPYDVAPNVDTTGDGLADEGSLRGSSEVVAERIRDEIQRKVADAGLEIIEARITYLAYAPEIAAVMLQRQQASAIIDARKMIVDGAVGMVEMALERLSENDVVELDEERKAAMVSNLLVVLCGNHDAQPVVNSGSLY
jgi:regulator of protease activity HflC (stomatin/prohibitin superfamily)